VGFTLVKQMGQRALHLFQITAATMNSMAGRAI
jgi:hypothetical protein